MPIDERIDIAGDYDEYGFTTSHPIHAAIDLRFDPSHFGAGIDVRVLSASGDPAWFTNLALDVERGIGGGGEFTLAPGSWVLQVTGLVYPPLAFRGSYRVTLPEIDERPEGTVKSVSVGDTVSEAIDPLGDVDIYDLVATRGQDLIIQIAGYGEPDPEGGGFSLGVWWSDSTHALAGTGTPTGDTVLASHATDRFTIPDTATTSSSSPRAMADGCRASAARTASRSFRSTSHRNTTPRSSR